MTRLTIMLLAATLGGGCKHGAAGPASRALASRGCEGKAIACAHATSDVVEVSDVADGVSVRYEAGEASEVQALQARVAELAARINRHAASSPHPECHGAMHAGMHMLVPSTARVDQTASGAQLVLIPRNPGSLGELRQQAREHPPRLSCPCASCAHELAKSP